MESCGERSVIRPRAICVFRRGDRILVSFAVDPKTGGRYARTIGGAVEFGEALRGRLATRDSRGARGFGVKIKTKGETKRDRRIAPDEERRLLEAADKLDCAEHAFAGAQMRDRIVGALETACRLGEMLKSRTGMCSGTRTKSSSPQSTRRTRSHAAFRSSRRNASRKSSSGGASSA